MTSIFIISHPGPIHRLFADNKADILWLLEASEKLFTLVFCVNMFIVMCSQILGQKSGIQRNYTSLNNCQTFSAFSGDSHELKSTRRGCAVQAEDVRYCTPQACTSGAPQPVLHIL